MWGPNNHVTTLASVILATEKDFKHLFINIAAYLEWRKLKFFFEPLDRLTYCALLHNSYKKSNNPTLEKTKELTEL